MDRALFFAALRKRDSGIFGTSLSQKQVDGIEAILAEAERRKTPLVWLAYMLATAYGKCAHRFLAAIADTSDRETPNLLATLSCVSPDATKSLISNTDFSTSFDNLAVSPKVWRLRSTISRVLSALVPISKWEGLTQDGVSQLWRTISPFGTRVLFSNSHATTWAYASPSARDPLPIWPCPNGCRQPSHSQHSEGPLMAVLARSRSLNGMIFLGIFGYPMFMKHVHSFGSEGN